jgi:hypothetical protein
MQPERTSELRSGDSTPRASGHPDALTAAFGFLQCPLRLRVESTGENEEGPMVLLDLFPGFRRAGPRAPGVSRYSFPVSSFRLIGQADGCKNSGTASGLVRVVQRPSPSISNGALICTIGHLVT